MAVAVCSVDVREMSDSEPVMAAYRTGENNGCTSVRFAYGGKGFSGEDVPTSMITGRFRLGRMPIYRIRLYTSGWSVGPAVAAVLIVEGSRGLNPLPPHMK